MKKNKNISREEARKNIKTIPERVYREIIGEDEAVLIVYLFDSHYSFNHAPGKKPDEKFIAYVDDKGIDLNIPLVGYAIGIPPIENDPGGFYSKGDYDLEEDEFDGQDCLDEDSIVPDDSNESSYQ